MTNFVIGAGLVSGVLRAIVITIIAVLAIVCLFDWLARTRRINPFNPVARFLRTTVDPLFAPMERRVVRAGGLPSSAPWWTLAIAVVAGILLITAVDFVMGQIAGAAFALSAGPQGIFILLVQWTFLILRAALLIRVVVSWLPISPYSPWVRWSFVLTEPILRPLRSVIPTLGMFDITPLIAYFLLGLLENIILRF